MVVDSKARTSVLIVDEYALSREAVCLLLLRVLPDATVIEASSSHEKFSCRPGRMDLILLGLRLPYSRSFAMLRDLRSRFPSTPVVLLSDAVDAGISAMARAQGACGLFHSSGSAEDLLEVMRLVLDGTPVFPLDLCMMGARGDFKFSPRQTEVLTLLCKGKSNKEIAVSLNMSGNTVRTHISAIFHILGVRNRTEAVISGRYLI